jgi:lipoate-protein ligase A
MTEPLRVIDTGEQSARMNVAITAALTELHIGGRIGDTLRFHLYPNCVLIGRHQVLEHAVKQDVCREDGIEIARRVTGGGSVYMAPGALAWDLIIDRNRLGVRPSDVTHKIGEAVAAGIARLGLPARYRPESEVEISGRKVCGMSGYSEADTITYQGTVLIDTDLRVMGRYLCFPANTLRGVEQELSTRMANLRDFLGRLPNKDDLRASIANGFVRALGRDPAMDTISPEETACAEKLYREEYGQDPFVFGDPIVGKESTIVGRDGGVEVFIRLLAGPARKIDQIFLTGAFVVSPPRVIPDLEAALRGIALQDAPRLAAEFLQDRLVEIRGVTRDCIPRAISKAQ